MAMGVIDGLEVIDIDHEQGFVRADLAIIFQPGLEGPAVTAT